MKLYKVTVTVPVASGTYYVAAENVGMAESLVLAAEDGSELQCGGVVAIEVVATFGREEDTETLLVSDEAIGALGLA